ncbi:hypothetical protein TNCV_1287821 [Trichonephila clavipes]|nr:hypothetical protein TNCV_1287821 [Trichonephila clavipes]
MVKPEVDTWFLDATRHQRKRTSKGVPLGKQNRRQTLAQMTVQYSVGAGASVSEHTVQRALFDMGVQCKRLTRGPI